MSAVRGRVGRWMAVGCAGVGIVAVFFLVHGSAQDQTVPIALPVAPHLTPEVTRRGDSIRVVTRRTLDLDTTTMLPIDLTLDQPFGQAVSIAGTADGGVVVFDARWESGPSLLRFSPTGELLGKIGGTGEGPGEYSASSGGLLTMPDGAILLQVRSLARVNRYDRSGVAIGEVRVPLSGNLRGGMVPGPTGTFYVPVVHAGTAGPVVHTVQFASSGDVIATIDSPPLPYPTIPSDEFAPRTYVSILPDGRAVTAESDRIGFTIWPTRGSDSLLEVRLVGNRPPARYLDAERAAWDRQLDWFLKYVPGELPRGKPSVPQQKQELSGLVVDVTGRVWLRRTSESTKADWPAQDPAKLVPPDVPFVERGRFLGFDSTGTFLGEIELPAWVGAESFGKQYVWVLRRDADGESIVSRYRLPF